MNKPSDTHRKLKGFEQHGVFILGVEQSEALSRSCPFCGKHKKFSINVDKMMWRCWSCGEQGDFDKFLKLINNIYVKALASEIAKPLAKDRGLRIATLKRWGVGWSEFGQFYTIPQRGFRPGSITDIKRYTIGGKSLSTTGGHVGLIMEPPGALPESNRIWLCEGEWDGMALWECMTAASDSWDRIYSVPGASSLPKKMLDIFYDTDVIICYDNDEAGRKGGLLACGKLDGIARSISFIQWPSGLPDGFDVRDYLIAHESDRKKTYREIIKLVSDEKPLVQVIELAAGEDVVTDVVSSGQGMEVSEVEAVYGRWLSMRSMDCLDVMFGSIFANRMSGDPLWMLLVAPPGGMKSELLMSLGKAPRIVSTSTLTPQALISGMNFSGGGDPSLIPKLNNKVLIIKDLTTILEMHPMQRDEIFGILRDAYDGKVEKVFGNMVTRRYKSLFGILAGVTPVIESINRTNATLGERFLKYHIRTSGQIDGSDAIRQALLNIKQNDAMRNELSEVGYEVLNRTVEDDEYPDIDSDMLENIIKLAQWIAKLRGVVDRERYTGRIQYKPMTEVGTRLAKQLCKLAYGISVYRREETVSKKTYRVLVQVARDTAPDRVEEIVKQLYIHDPLNSKMVSEVSRLIKFPEETTRFLLQDLTLLKITEKEPGRIGYYKLSDSMIVLMDDLELYKKTKRKKKKRRNQ